MTRKSYFVTFCVLLLASATPLTAQQFGGSLAISGEQALVGETSNGTLPGIVYVFERDGAAWREVTQLLAGGEQGPPDGFGRALAADGEFLIVGSPIQGENSGAAYIFRSDGSGGWRRLAQLSAGDGSPDDAFGGAVALAGDVALVSAPGKNDGAGAVYVFLRGGDGSWSEQTQLRAGEGEESRRFGARLALDGPVMLVASADQRDAEGAVFSFRRDAASGMWAAEGKLPSDGLGESSGFGATLGLRDGVALVGAPNFGQRVGTVVIFEFDEEAGAWTQRTRLAPFEASPNTRFGASVTFDGTATWVGAPGDAGGLGAFYVFDGDASGGWSSVSKLASGQLDGRAAFSSSVVIKGDVALVGASGVDSRAGAAVVFERGIDMWNERNIVVNEMRGLPAITGGEVECEADRVAGYECSNVNVVSFMPIKDIGGVRGTRVNDVWGWTDPESGAEIAIVGRTDGTSFVDISDPSNPVYLGNLPKTEGSLSSVWRDMKVYRNYVYIVADGAANHGMQVFDLSQLRRVGNQPALFEATFNYEEIHSAHNIVINEETGYAFAVGSSSGGETCGGGLHMISLAEPSRPEFAGCFADPATGRRQTGYSHDAQCVAYHGPDADHSGKEICMGSNETALSIADVTDKENPVTISMASYPNVAYTHQGWLTEDHRYFYQNDEGDEPQGLVPGTRTLVWDVTDLDDPILVKEYIATTTTTDHNLYVRGNMMYQSNYGSGLRVLDVSDPESPVEIGFLDTTPYGGGGSWSNYPFFDSGVIIATSMSEGLFIAKSTGTPRLIP